MRIHGGVALLLALPVAAAFGVCARAQQPSAASASAGAGAKPELLGQFSYWGAYTASPGGKKICFAIAKPVTAVTDPPRRRRSQPYFFISTRPADKVVNEVSIDFGYPLKHESQATAQVGETTYALYTEGSGAWIKNAGEEAHMVDGMRKGDSAIVHGVSTHGTKTTDTYSLKGVTEALDHVAKACSR